MFEKILVCLDGSELAEQILSYAIRKLYTSAAGWCFF